MSRERLKRSGHAPKSLYRHRAALDAVKQLAMIEGGLGPADEMGMDELVPQHLAAVPRCDDGGVYTINSLGEPSTCSIHGILAVEPVYDGVGDAGAPGLTVK